MKNMALHIMDIIQNSITAQASELQLYFNEKTDLQIVEIILIDNGNGISPEYLKKVTDPYTTSRTTRKVGLGIPLLKQNAERTGGNLEIISEVNKGTKIKAVFHTNHPDCIPVGDIPGVIMLTIGANPKLEFKYMHSFDTKKYIFKTTEIREILEDVPINDVQVLAFIKETIQNNIEQLNTKEIH